MSTSGASKRHQMLTNAVHSSSGMQGYWFLSSWAEGMINLCSLVIYHSSQEHERVVVTLDWGPQVAETHREVQDGESEIQRAFLSFNLRFCLCSLSIIAAGSRRMKRSFWPFRLQDKLSKHSRFFHLKAWPARFLISKVFSSSLTHPPFLSLALSLLRISR